MSASPNSEHRAPCASTPGLPGACGQRVAELVLNELSRVAIQVPIPKRRWIQGVEHLRNSPDVNVDGRCAVACLVVPNSRATRLHGSSHASVMSSASQPVIKQTRASAASLTASQPRPKIALMATFVSVLLATSASKAYVPVRALSAGTGRAIETVIASTSKVPMAAAPAIAPLGPYQALVARARPESTLAHQSAQQTADGESAHARGPAAGCRLPRAPTALQSDRQTHSQCEGHA